MVFGVQFYPTPTALVESMMQLVDWERVQFALEPSAGKGDIAEGIKRHVKQPIRLDCAEIDPDLRAVLRQRGYNVVANDFLAWDAQTRYDLIAMNPPFRDGDRHLLHAIDLMKHGGQIVCLLNASTLEHTENPHRRELMNRLETYGARVQKLAGAFLRAERRTDVDVVLIYVDIPDESREEINLDGMRRAADLPETDCQTSDIVDADFFKAIVQRYQMEARIGLKMIDQFQHLNRFVDDRGLIKLSVSSGEQTEMSLQNKYVRELRVYYWKTLFEAKEMQKLMTREVRGAYLAKIQSFRALDFTMDNILQVKIELSKTLVSNVEDAIITVFDDLTYEHSMGKNKNIHYYNGWKTNQACRVNKKVILPFYGLYDPRWGGCWSAYKAKDYLIELEKILGYLDNGRTDGMSCDNVIHAAFNTAADKYDGRKLHCKFFDLEFKKKGTVHIFFTDERLLKKFNLFAGRKKNWLPDGYGKTRYDDMTAEEKEIVRSFEGKQSYEDTVSGQAFYIAAPELVMIGE